jgi:hypothetical protein
MMALRVTFLAVLPGVDYFEILRGDENEVLELR